MQLFDSLAHRFFAGTIASRTQLHRDSLGLQQQAQDPERADALVALTPRRRICARRFFPRESLGKCTDPESLDPVSLAKRLPDSAKDGLAVALSTDRRCAVSEGCGDQCTRSGHLALRSLPAASAKREIHQQFALCHPGLATRIGAMRPGVALVSPAKLVKQLNRTRTPETKLTFHKLPTLVAQRLDDIAPHLPKSCRVYVLFDTWYDNQHLQKQIRAHGWHWICATRSNRNVSDRPLSHWWSHVDHQRITRVVVRSATRRHVYSTRHTVGQRRHYPDPVVAIISKRKQRDTSPAYFLCSDTSLSVQTILKYYGYRWQAEVDNWFLKERFGLADYRVQSIEALLRWHTLVFAAYAFVQHQRIVPLLKEPTAQLQPLGEVLRDHQREHVRQTVRCIADLVRQGHSDDELLDLLVPD